MRFSRHSLATPWYATKAAVLSFIDDDAFTQAAAVAFYSALSFAPIIVISVWIAAHIAPALQKELVQQLGSLLGAQVQQVAEMVVKSAEDNQSAGNKVGAIGVVTLIVSASAAFAQLQEALNTMWHVDAQPSNAIWMWVKRRLLSFGIIAVLAFLLLTSLVVSTLLNVVMTSDGAVWSAVNELIAIAVFAVLFAGLFRFVPDARVPLRFAAIGGVVTAVLFAIGKWAIAVYLSGSFLATAYGPAGAIVLLLLWVYYAALIVLGGAALTHALLVARGGAVRPMPYADVKPRKK